MSDETVMGCGHSFSAIVKKEDGTHACGPCRARGIKKRPQFDPATTDPDWNLECIVCGAKPAMPLTEMCGPCTFGEAETMGGNW